MSTITPRSLSAGIVNPTEFRCAFCGKLQEQVERLIAGPNLVYICYE